MVHTSVGEDLQTRIAELRELRRALLKQGKSYVVPPPASYPCAMPLVMPSLVRAAIRNLQRRKVFYTSRDAERQVRMEFISYAARCDSEEQKIKEEQQFDDQFGHLMPSTSIQADR